MTLVNFFENGGNITGFSLSGHSTSSQDDDEGRLVCSAVSSAAYMAANTLIEIIGADVTATVSDANMRICVKDKLDECQPILKGFKLHIVSLKEQYRNNIQVITEV